MSEAAQIPAGIIILYANQIKRRWWSSLRGDVGAWERVGLLHLEVESVSLASGLEEGEVPDGDRSRMSPHLACILFQAFEWLRHFL